MKKKILKVLALVACAVLLVVGSIAGTLAYMKSTATVTNTFTVGNVNITMTEAKVDVYGVAATPETRVTTNEYKLIPSHNYTKDPTIYVTKGSEVCYLFVKVENGISAIEAEGNTTIAKQMEANGWTALTGVDNVYYYETTVDARTATEDVKVPVFTNFTVANDAIVADYANAKIIVTAYAVQADGFDGNINAAWTAASAAQAQG